MTPEMKKKLVELQARASLASIAIPSPFGDAVGLAADGLGYAVDPSQRTPLNFGLSAAGLLPFVPASSVLRRATDATQKARPELFDDEAAEVAKRALDRPTSSVGRAVAATISPEEQFALARAVNKGNPRAMQVPDKDDPEVDAVIKALDARRGKAAAPAATPTKFVPDYGGRFFKETPRGPGQLTFKSSVHLKDGSRLSGFNDRDQTVLYGYTKNGDLFTLRREFLDPTKIVGSRDSGKTAEMLRTVMGSAKNVK
jgi:hypothetical protein